MRISPPKCDDLTLPFIATISHGYVPQNYFFNADGSKMDVAGPNAKYAHFFGGEQALADAMDKAIGLSGGKSEL